MKRAFSHPSLLQSRLSISTNDASVRDLTADKKWFILCNESALTSMGTVIGNKKNVHRISIPTNTTTLASNTTTTTNNESTVDSDYLLTPAYYIHALLQRDSKNDVRSKLVSDLSVRLRTMPIKWAQDFIEQNGIDALFHELAFINKVNTRYTYKNRNHCLIY